MPIIKVLAGAALVTLAASAYAQDAGYNPHHGFVPDAATAIAIGRATLIPIYGKGILSEEPFTAKRNGDVWTVSGTLHCGAPDPRGCVGGAAEVKLSAKDGRILHVTHYQ